MDWMEKEKSRREKIAAALKQFDEFLRSTKFTKDDIVVILKTFEVWRKNLSNAKKVQ